MREGGFPNGVGNWFCKPGGFPHGLMPVSQAAHRAGLKFFLWFAPERFASGLQIAREHPEFVFGGTKGGLLIDATSRVLTADGTVLPGLYACGGAAASLFKGATPAPGAALGAALVEAFLAATDQPERRREL